MLLQILILVYTTDAQNPLLHVSALPDDGTQGVSKYVGGDFVHLLRVYLSACKVVFIHCYIVLCKYPPRSAEHIFTFSCT